jgi:methionine biosynthesis protein MetW
MRADLQIIADRVNPGARVLDLGCGAGDLLAHLQKDKQVNGYGLDVDPSNIAICFAKGVNVLEQDLDQGIANFQTDSFDMVVMTETLQSVQAPHKLVHEMLRIAEECVVTFPNFGHWRCRLHLLFKGKMPVAEHLPHSWYDTPNIHLCTFADFEGLCLQEGFRIIERFVVDARYQNGMLINRFPNVFGTLAFYRLGREKRR